MPAGAFTGRSWIGGEVGLKRCWERRELAKRRLCWERTQFECWRLRAEWIRDVKEQIIVLALEVEERAIALRRR